MSHHITLTLSLRTTSSPSNRICSSNHQPAPQSTNIVFALNDGLLKTHFFQISLCSVKFSELSFTFHKGRLTDKNTLL
jgi:hypothetical protein